MVYWHLIGSLTGRFLGEAGADVHLVRTCSAKRGFVNEKPRPMESLNHCTGDEHAHA